MQADDIAELIAGALAKRDAAVIEVDTLEAQLRRHADDAGMIHRTAVGSIVLNRHLIVALSSVEDIPRDGGAGGLRRRIRDARYCLEAIDKHASRDAIMYGVRDALKTLGDPNA
jgi:hypothetical protein